jgi:HEAT repeat protein
VGMGPRSGESTMSEPEPGGPRPSAAASETRDQIRKHIKDLSSGDYEVRTASARMLGTFGEEAAEALVDTLIKKPGHPALTTFSEALAEIGKPSLNVLLHGLTHIQEIRKEEDVYLLESFVELLAPMAERRVAAPLLEQLAKLDRRVKKNHDKQIAHCCEAAKIKIHRVLAGLGEKGGLDDLLALLGDGRKRVRDGVVDALTRVGDRRAIVPLIRLYDIEEHVSFSGAQFIKEALREIARRERVQADDKMFKDLAPAERAILEKVLPKARNGRE